MEVEPPPRAALAFRAAREASTMPGCRRKLTSEEKHLAYHRECLAVDERLRANGQTLLIGLAAISGDPEAFRPACLER
jgi:hypothetical protein